MKQLLPLLPIALFPVCLIASINNQPEIRLTVPKDRVLPVKQRISVLEAAEAYLDRSDELFVTEIAAVASPYSNGAIETVDEKPVISIIEYKDPDILELIQSNFATQIRGTIAKGDVYYLQLNGGGKLEAGDSFPAQIPQIEGESFTVTILEITRDGYTLKMNDVVQGVTFEKSSGIIRNN